MNRRQEARTSLVHPSSFILPNSGHLPFGVDDVRQLQRLSRLDLELAVPAALATDPPPQLVGGARDEVAAGDAPLVVELLGLDAAEVTAELDLLGVQPALREDLVLPVAEAEGAGRDQQMRPAVSSSQPDRTVEEVADRDDGRTAGSESNGDGLASRLPGRNLGDCAELVGDVEEVDAVSLVGVAAVQLE